MNLTLNTAVASLCAVAALALSPSPALQDTAALQDVMKQAAPTTQPGKSHQQLGRFVGKWETQTRVFMGDRPTQPESGSAEWSWLMPGRWLSCHSKGDFMGTTVEQFSVIGYDNFKKSFVATGVTSIDTAMNRFEGDMTPDGKSLVAYGTIDEYLTGEHDKMVEYAWRFVDADRIVLEVSDLALGEQNAKVVEVAYTRVK